ncbi:DUF421 domain-containing protein [Pseudalkalibacillus sp. R45]|uniref:DUF421 domain-containing protein n=1 Tax=Pseudalkalibacillus sp. R45 TaxID=3457433 RepID=UPI003FCE245C
MDFFSGQETLTVVQWILRGVVGFFFFVIIAKLMGDRSISQATLLDFVIVLVIGNIIAHPLSDEGLGLKGSMITMGVLVILYLAGVFLSLRSRKIRRLFVPKPLPLIENGKIHYKNMNKARISIDVLLSELRKEKAEDIGKVALALWEPGGKVSTFLRNQYQPITPSTFGTPIKPFHIPKTVIREREIDYEELRQLGKDEEWLLHKLSSTYNNIKLEEILLATVDQNEKMNVFLYHKS